MMVRSKTKPDKRVSLHVMVRTLLRRLLPGVKRLQNSSHHNTAGHDAKRKLGAQEAEPGTPVNVPLPEDDNDPAEAADDEDGNGGGAVPGVVADGSLVNDEDGQDGAGEDEDGAKVVEALHFDLDKELVVFGPKD